MIELLVVAGLIVWLIVGGLVAIFVCRGIRIADEKAAHVETQCDFVFEASARRCLWYRGHPASWGHRYDSPRLLAGGGR